MDIKAAYAQVKTADGSMPAYVAEPAAAGRYPVVLVIQEIFGVNKNIEDITRRIAGEGYVALAPDLFYRSGANQVIPYEEIQKGIEQAMKLKEDGIVADLRSSLDYLAQKPNANAAKAGITGFCMGGRISFLAACDLPDRITAAAPFYGGGTIALLPKAGSIKAPLHLFFGQLDHYIPQEQVDAIGAKLKELGKRFAIDNYAGADHGFFCSDRATYDEKAATDSWAKLKTFFREHLA